MGLITRLINRYTDAHLNQCSNCGRIANANYVYTDDCKMCRSEENP